MRIHRDVIAMARWWFEPRAMIAPAGHTGVLAAARGDTAGVRARAGLAAPFGAIADQTRTWSLWPRRIVLLVAAFALTTALGSLVEMESLIFVAFIPVAAGCLMLERYSRLPPAVPSAVAAIVRAA